MCVTEKNDLRTAQDPEWQLLAEFCSSGKPGGELQISTELRQAVQGLGLEPGQSQNIQKTFLETVQRVIQRQNQEQRCLPLLLRIWTSAVHVEGGLRLGVEHIDWCKGHGWGFFLIEKPGLSSQGSPRGPCHLQEHIVELFLYQEGRFFQRRP
jgi:hypothetical protein